MLRQAISSLAAASSRPETLCAALTAVLPMTRTFLRGATYQSDGNSADPSPYRGRAGEAAPTAMPVATFQQGIREFEQEMGLLFGESFLDGTRRSAAQSSSDAAAASAPPIPSPPSAPSSTSSSSGSDPASHAAPQRLTHVDASGAADMVDVGDKAPSVRTARAAATVHLGPAAFSLVKENRVKKGDVLVVARIAGIMAAKRTSDLIPLCHPLLLDKVHVDLELDPSTHCVLISSEVRCGGRTGVEMEALTAASVAALTVYDMCKAVDKGITITGVRLEEKTGGKSGDYARGGERAPDMHGV